LHVLAFLTPLIVMYEIGLLVYLSSADGSFRETISAHKSISGFLARFFTDYGAASLYLPGIAMAFVLVVWQVISRDRWRVRPGVLVGMTCESVIWMVPLLVFGLVLSMEAHRAGAVVPTPMMQGWQANLTLSVGAGLYEELLFRLVLIAALHALFHDLLTLKEPLASGLAVVGSAITFALYHDLRGVDGVFLMHRFVFFAAAGAYFGVVFLLRGFGIVVGTHAAYDIMVLVVLPALRR
jgi:hypothetical protein